MIKTISDSELLIRTPSNIIIYGGTWSGKTELVYKLIKEGHKIFDRKFDSIKYFYGIHNSRILDMQKLGVDTFAGLPPEDSFKATNTKHTLAFFDDLLTQTTEEYLTSLFSRIGHHCCVTCVYITQSLFSKQLKVARQNCPYYVLFDNPTSQLQVKTFGRQVFRDSKLFFDAYSDAVKEPWGYLFCDLHAKSSKLLQLRSSIFDTPILYVG